MRRSSRRGFDRAQLAVSQMEGSETCTHAQLSRALKLGESVRSPATGVSNAAATNAPRRLNRLLQNSGLRFTPQSLDPSLSPLSACHLPCLLHHPSIPGALPYPSCSYIISIRSPLCFTFLSLYFKSRTDLIKTLLPT